jgi:hypothetical protein
VLALTLMGVGVVWVIDRMGPGRRTASIGSAAVVAPTVLDVIVDSCNGDPQLVELEESPVDVRIRVTAWRPGYFEGADDCLDGLRVLLAEPLGERLLIDAGSGAVLEVSGSGPSGS